MENTNRIFAPILFVFFTFFVGLLLMNMFIAVLSEVYMNVQEQNAQSWEIFINDLMAQVMAFFRFSLIFFKSVILNWKLRKAWLTLNSWYDSRKQKQLQQAESVDLEAGLSEEEQAIQQKQLQMNNTSAARKPLVDELYQEQVSCLDESGVFDLALELKIGRNEKTTHQIYKLLQEIAVRQQEEMVTMKQEISQLKGMVQKLSNK